MFTGLGLINDANEVAGDVMTVVPLDHERVDSASCDVLRRGDKQRELRMQAVGEPQRGVSSTAEGV